MDPDLIPDVFNVFMHTDVEDEQRLVFRQSPATAGDYIDLRAEIDVLAAVSACPSETSASNGGEPKRIGLEVWVEEWRTTRRPAASSGPPSGEGK